MLKRRRLVRAPADLDAALDDLSLAAGGRNWLTASASGTTVANPSPIRPASSIAFGPKPETTIGVGVSGRS